MIKIIRTLLTTLFLYLCLIPSLSSQTYVDLAIKQIILPDSIVFCENRETPVKVSISLIYGVSIDSFQVSLPQIASRAKVD